MAKIPTLNKIEEALKKMDEITLNRSQVSSLLREFITEEEISEYEANNAEGVQWEKQEEFLISLYKISSSKEKISFWNFIYEFVENFNPINSSLDYIKKANEEIKNSEIFKKLLAYVLTIGNILNGGTQKGQADGFNLDILKNMNNLKDTSNKTLIQYICAMIKKEDEDFGNIKKQFLGLTEVSKMSFSETQSSINKLKKDLKDNVKIFEKIKSDCKDQYVDKGLKIVETYTADLEAAEKNYNDYVKITQETILYFGYETKDPKYKSPEEFFVLINDFLNDVDKSIPKTEPKKVFNRKHEVGKKIGNGNSGNMDMDEVLKQLKNRVSA